MMPLHLWNTDGARFRKYHLCMMRCKFMEMLKYKMKAALFWVPCKRASRHMQMVSDDLKLLTQLVTLIHFRLTHKPMHLKFKKKKDPKTFIWYTAEIHFSGFQWGRGRPLNFYKMFSLLCVILDWLQNTYDCQCKWMWNWNMEFYCTSTLCGILWLL